MTKLASNSNLIPRMQLELRTAIDNQIKNGFEVHKRLNNGTIVLKRGSIIKLVENGIIKNG